MRQGGPNNRRPRGRHHNNNNGDNRGGAPQNSMGMNNRPRSAASLRHQTFDSNGPDVRVRGNAWQVCEKYQTLARDATSSGDKVLAESYLQHAEHYYRIIEAINEATAAEQRARGLVPDQQPPMPNNYYGPDGTPNGTSANDETPALAQAEVQPRVQPAATPDPFFTPEEGEEGNGPQALAAGTR